MAKISIKNGRVWDGEHFLDADVLIDGNTVVRVAPDITEEVSFCYDATGLLVCPGLVDIHMHMRGISSDKYGIDPAIACYPFGVTAAADGGAAYGDKTLLDTFMVKNVVFASAGIHNNDIDLSRVEERLGRYGDKAVGVKSYFDTTVSEVSDISPLRKLCEFAHGRGLRVMVHCNHSPTPMADILALLGEADILTHAYHGGMHNAAKDSFESVKQAMMRGVVIDLGMAGYVHTDLSVLKQGILNGAAPYTISTDITKSSAYVRGGRYGLTLCMSIARALGMAEENVLLAVTSRAAKALGKENEWGYLREGRTADVAVLDPRAEAYDLTDKAGNRIQGHDGYRCVLTVTDGMIVYRY